MNYTLCVEDDIKTYDAVNLRIETFIDIMEDILRGDVFSGGYMVRHSKFKGISYNSDDEYVDQFLQLYVPPVATKKDDAAENAGDSENVEKTNETKENGGDVADADVDEKDIHDLPFDTKYSIDAKSRIVYICDPGTGNRINLNSVLNTMQKVVGECSGYSIKYRDDAVACEINGIRVNPAKKSIKLVAVVAGEKN